uniref:39S ribosomal protein L48, mitochondrial n=1 Tax=Epinephelus lanceolatus TaxID=310571 RepID=UPI001445472F|nr:39S ribosomal protein L48, mitochondrial [Epinephelus lanceolatus]
MSAVLRKLQVSVTQQAFVLNQALTLCRATTSIQHPNWASVHERQYKSMPTHGIGRWRHLLLKEPQKKRKEKHLKKAIIAETDTAYGTLNVKMSGHDMTTVEHYAKFAHNLCNWLGIEVAESYALPTKSTEVMLMQEQSTKMYTDAVLKTHERVVQLSCLDATLCPIFMDVLLKNQPEGVQLSMNEHSEADYQARFKSRPALEGLIEKINQ